jgi:hypothetical protein
MLASAIENLRSALAEHAWTSELAGILPLSALLDFVDMPSKLHIFQLMGAVPLWSWPVTPSGSRLLLSSGAETDTHAHLDLFGNSLALMGLDGRYGDSYFISSPGTLRLCLDSLPIKTIENLHENMRGKHLRVQYLDVVHVCRATTSRDQRTPSDSWPRRIFQDPWWMFSPWYLGVSGIGWLTWSGIVAMSWILECYLSFAFALLIPMTGSIVFLLFGHKSQHLLVSDHSPYNRLVLVTEHTNAMSWTVFWGESTLVNSLLNRPLEPLGPSITSVTISRTLRMALQVCIAGQWALVVGAAATKGFDAYGISFWIIFCILTHAFLIPPSTVAGEWLKSCGCLELRRYRLKVSSRRALLNTIMALNPDTFPESTKTPGGDDRSALYEGALKWIDPILARGSSRLRWESATREAMAAAADYTSDVLTSTTWQGTSGELVGREWNETYPPDRAHYWRSSILEGIYAAERVKSMAGIGARKVDVA